MVVGETMRSIYSTLQKLREQEKREKVLQYVEAESERQQKEDEVRQGYRRLEEERQVRNQSMGMRVVQDYLNMQRHMNLQKAEGELKQATAQVEDFRAQMLQAQVECKVMERVIETVEESERKRYNRLLERFNDEIAIMGWSRNNEIAK